MNASTLDTILRLECYTTGKFGLCDHVKQKMIFTLVSYNFCMLTPIPKAWSDKDLHPLYILASWEIYKYIWVKWIT